MSFLSRTRRAAAASVRSAFSAAGWLIAFLSVAASGAQSQQHSAQNEPIASASSEESSEVPDVPGLSGLLHGLNAGVSFTGVHDAQSGWAVISQPVLGFSFNDTFSIDVSIPIYNYRLAQSLSARPRPREELVPLRAELGDLLIALHAQLQPPKVQYQITLSANVPTGDEVYGLSSGRVSFDLSNHLQHEFRYVAPQVELGVGDSSTLANQLVKRNYTSLGPLAHFQAGFAFPLIRGASFEAGAYEQLPLGDQKIYESITRKKKTVTVVSGRSVTEDNGFTTSLDIPTDGHATLSAYYNHSLRLQDDTVAFGISYVLRNPDVEKKADVSPDDILERSLAAGTSGVSSPTPR